MTFLIILLRYLVFVSIQIIELLKTIDAGKELNSMVIKPVIPHLLSIPVRTDLSYTSSLRGVQSYDMLSGCSPSIRERGAPMVKRLAVGNFSPRTYRDGTY